MMWIVTYGVSGTVLEPLYFGSRDGGYYREELVPALTDSRLVGQGVLNIDINYYDSIGYIVIKAQGDQEYCHTGHVCCMFTE